MPFLALGLAACHQVPVGRSVVETPRVKADATLFQKPVRWRLDGVEDGLGWTNGEWRVGVAAVAAVAVGAVALVTVAVGGKGR